MVARELFQRLGRAVSGLEHGEALRFEGHAIVEPHIRLIVYDKNAFARDGDSWIGGGQVEIELAALAGAAVDADGAALRVDDLLRNGQAQSRAVDLRAGNAEEAVEELRLILLGDAGAMVDDREAHVAAVVPGADDDLARRAWYA